MIETMIDLPGVIAKSDDADFLRELVRDAAQRLMDIEVATADGQGPVEIMRRTSMAKPTVWRWQDWRHGDSHAPSRSS